MKKFIFGMVVAAMLTGCASKTQKPPVVEYVNKLVLQYPNYRTNEIANSAILDSIANHVRPVGAHPEDLRDVDFKFERIIGNPQTGGKSALFTSTGCQSDIENPNGNPKYLITTINIRVLGSVDDSTAATLDGKAIYSIDGVLHAWDAADVFSVTHSIGNSFDFGTYILDNMTITQNNP